MALREIIFRGKRLNKGEWVEGFFAEKKDPLLESDVRNAFILAQARGDFFATWFPVDPATVGQYTGLMDKNGKRIFEGDILCSRYDDRFPDEATIEVVKWFRNGWFTQQWKLTPDEIVEDGVLTWSEVIGNIHDREFGGERK